MEMISGHDLRGRQPMPDLRPVMVLPADPGRLLVIEEAGLRR
ncbi:hypothetical protein ABZZ17_20475 [Streptomyces sp. NPDC006512]